MQAKTERFEMRLDGGLLGEVDGWRSEQDGHPSRAEAIRQLLEAGLRVKSRDAIEISDGEKLILLMLCDLMKKQGIDSDTNPEFITSAILGGHYWAFKWDLQGVFHGHVDKPQVVSDVGNFLDMWSFIEFGYAKLSKKEKEHIEKEVPPFGKNVAFRGFDGNYEAEYLSVARFLIDNMGRFSKFKGRDLNSHAPTVAAYRRMYPAFEPMRVGLGGGVELGPHHIVELLKAMMHPDRR